MINRKRIKYVNTKRINKLKCINNTFNSIRETNILINESKTNVNIKLFFYILLIFPFTTFLSCFMLSAIPIDNEKIIFIFKDYNIGQKVLLKDNVEYYCIENCSGENRIFKLLKVDPMDINSDYKIDENDKIVFDVSKSNIYDTSNKGNIGYFLENFNIINKLKNTEPLRLLTSEEYISIRNNMNFGYDWDDGNWLANESIGSWWLETSILNSVFAVTPRGSYKLSKPNEKNYIRPVIITYKDNVK